MELLLAVVDVETEWFNTLSCSVTARGVSGEEEEGETGPPLVRRGGGRLEERGRDLGGCRCGEVLSNSS